MVFRSISIFYVRGFATAFVLAQLLAFSPLSAHAQNYPFFTRPLKSKTCASMLMQLSQLQPVHESAKAQYESTIENLSTFRTLRLGKGKHTPSLDQVLVASAKPKSKDALSTSDRILLHMSEPQDSSETTKLGITIRGRESIDRYLGMVEESALSLSQSIREVEKYPSLQVANILAGTTALVAAETAINLILNTDQADGIFAAGFFSSLMIADMAFTTAKRTAFPKEDRRFVSFLESAKLLLGTSSAGQWIYSGNNYILESQVFDRSKDQKFLSQGDVERQWQFDVGVATPGHAMLPMFEKMSGRKLIDRTHVYFDYLLDTGEGRAEDYTLYVVMKAYPGPPKFKPKKPQSKTSSEWSPSFQGDMGTIK